MNSSPFIQRRARLLEIIDDGVAVIPTAPERLRNRDNPYPYRPDSYFWYLTGFPEPEAALVLAGGRSILFCRPRDETREIWNGFRHGPDAAREHFGFDEAYPITELETRLPDLIAGCPCLWQGMGYDTENDARIIRALNTVRARTRAGKQAPPVIYDLRRTLDEMRLVKDDAEQEIMRQAAAITVAGHRQAMRNCRPGDLEYTLEAELAAVFRRRGASGHAYGPIVASSENACILHYPDNDHLLEDGALVLIDAGCEWQCYAADITRTFPVNGRFTETQRACYEIVLAAQTAAIAAIRPGIPCDTPHQAAVRVLTQGMKDLRLLEGDLDNLIESGAYARFYMHNTSHWLGLDVHDAGDYKEGDAWRPLRAGMALTVEPGLYIRPAPDVPESLRGIGIRIEDDVFVTPEGCEIYTDAPKTVAEIETLMRGD
ncbi:MAG: aminopeptidase P N-terminal domain-containing protein [Zoogloeaceae bacterium]|jgi:Xaa-Pro aminopeptidase|nr:aminopeptidase P N-terminal domain-containing protein [Zoogloeaceae bacterium]